MMILLPLFWVIGSALVYWLIGYLFGAFAFYTLLIQIVMIAILFGFGVTLSTHKRNHKTWIKKLLIAFVVIFILLMRINVIQSSGFYELLANLRLTESFINLLIIYCGWSFFS